MNVCVEDIEWGGIVMKMNCMKRRKMSPIEKKMVEDS